jgi:two-component system, cell cycle sensor histidine kinase and response regulator CckA
MEVHMPEQDPLRLHVSRIPGSGHRATILVRQLLAFSHKQAPELHPLDVNAIVSNLQDTLQRIIGEHIVVRTDLGVDLPAVRADTSHLEQVIVNMVGYAGPMTNSSTDPVSPQLWPS